MRINFCLSHVPGNPFTLGLLDPMHQVAEAAEALGHEVSSGRNRLQRDAVNWVFGGFRGFDPALTRSYECVIVNLEQMGADATVVGDSYRELLAQNAVVDYHPQNPPSYGRSLDDVPLLSFGHSPRLVPASPVPLRDRPIDLLFLGLRGPRRDALLERVRACGVDVVTPEAPVFGPERDELVRSAKAVINISAYELTRFEQVRASLCLSLGTPVVSERRTLASDGERAFEPHVSWFDTDALEEFFRGTFGTPAWLEAAQEQVNGFTRVSTVPSVEHALEVLARRPALPLAPSPAPRQVNIGAGTGYRAGWLNVSTSRASGADVLVDDWSELDLGLEVDTAAHGRVTTGEAEAVLITPGPEGLLTGHLLAALRLLPDGATAQLEVPLGSSLAAAEALIGRFWAHGVARSRFELVTAHPVDVFGQPCSEDAALHLEVVLRKVPCTPGQMTWSRLFHDDLGGLLPPPPPPARPALGRSAAL
jgi:hypothetical protein